MAKKKTKPEIKLDFDLIWHKFEKAYENPDGADASWAGQKKVIEKLVDEEIKEKTEHRATSAERRVTN
jgi:hypothetical protein